jgi:exodeoxyribonuclease V gamma subunit
VLPLDDVESGAIQLAGRLAEFVDRLGAALDALGAAQTIEGWTDALAAAADALTATSERDAWQRAELDRVLDDVLAEARVAGAERGIELVPAEVRALLAERLQGRPTRANFRTGHLTVCTLMPMRSVPHRVVCLLGMDDGVFPRRSPRDGDDLMVADPHVGDRDPRTEDRQLLLDALMAASDRLIVTYAGNDERTNIARPPAVPIGELLDVDRRDRPHADGRAQDASSSPPAAAVRPAQLHARALAGAAPWSFDASRSTGARARQRPRRGRAVPAPSRSRPDAAAVASTTSSRFVRASRARVPAPAARHLARRLQPGRRRRAARRARRLERWGVGRRLLDGVLAGAGLDACIEAEIARGTLPPGRLALPVLDRIRPTVEEIAGHARRAFGNATAPESVDVRVVLPDGRPLSGTVAGVRDDVLGKVTFSRVGARHRIAAWVRLLALCAAHPTAASRR